MHHSKLTSTGAGDVAWVATLRTCSGGASPMHASKLAGGGCGVGGRALNGDAADGCPLAMLRVLVPVLGRDDSGADGGKEQKLVGVSAPYELGAS